MIRKKLQIPKAPAINLYYCSGMDEAYEEVFFKHDVNMKLDLIDEKDMIHGFSIADDLEDVIEIYLDVTLPRKDFIKAAVNEGTHAALAIIRRKSNYSFDDKQPIVLGKDTLIDDAIVDLVSKVCTECILLRYKKK